jgi:hypothetical protein
MLPPDRNRSTFPGEFGKCWPRRNLTAAKCVCYVNPRVDSSTAGPGTAALTERRSRRGSWECHRGQIMHELIAVLVAVLVPIACLGLILWLQRLEETLDADVAKTRANAIAKRGAPAVVDRGDPTTMPARQERSPGRAVSPLGAAGPTAAD